MLHTHNLLQATNTTQRRLWSPHIHTCSAAIYTEMCSCLAGSWELVQCCLADNENEPLLLAVCHTFTKSDTLLNCIIHSLCQAVRFTSGDWTEPKQYCLPNALAGLEISSSAGSLSLAVLKLLVWLYD